MLLVFCDSCKSHLNCTEEAFWKCNLQFKIFVKIELNLNKKENLNYATDILFEYDLSQVEFFAVNSKKLQCPNTNKINLQMTIFINSIIPSWKPSTFSSPKISHCCW